MRTFKEHWDDDWDDDDGGDTDSPNRAMAHEILSHHFPDHTYTRYNGKLDQYKSEGAFPHQAVTDLKDSGWKQSDTHTLTRPGNPDTGEIGGTTTTTMYSHPEEPKHHVVIQTGRWDDEDEDNITHSHVAMWTKDPDFVQHWKRQVS